MRLTAPLVLFCLLFAVACNSNSPKAPKSSLVPADAADATDKSLVAPEIVRVEKVTVKDGVKSVTVSNALGTYALGCSEMQESCLSLSPGTDYLLFNRSTKWKFPGAKDYITLAWLQGWSGTYTEHQDNIGLLPAKENSPIGMYWLESWSKK